MSASSFADHRRLTLGPGHPGARDLELIQLSDETTTSNAPAESPHSSTRGFLVVAERGQGQPRSRRRHHSGQHSVGRGRPHISQIMTRKRRLHARQWPTDMLLDPDRGGRPVHSSVNSCTMPHSGTRGRGMMARSGSSFAELTGQANSSAAPLRPIEVAPEAAQRPSPRRARLVALITISPYSRRNDGPARAIAVVARRRRFGSSVFQSTRRSHIHPSQIF